MATTTSGSCLPAYRQRGELSTSTLLEIYAPRAVARSFRDVKTVSQALGLRRNGAVLSLGTLAKDNGAAKVETILKMQLVELTGHGDHALAADGAYWIQHYFGQPVYCIVYIVLLCALWFHLTHGVWSCLHSLGLDNKTWLPRIKAIANVVATIVVLLFMAVPVYYLIVNVFGI